MTAPRLLTPRQIIITGGGAYILITSTPGATLTCGANTYTLGSAETSHAFEVDAGTYACTAALTGYTTASQNVTVTDGVTEITLKPYLLPAEYQQVEYLRSDGVAYMYGSVFGVASNQKIEIEHTVEDLSGSSTSSCNYIFGYSYYLLIGYWKGYVTVGNATANYSWSPGKKYKFSVINDTLYIDGVTTELTRNTNTQNYLFAYNPAEGAAPRKSLVISSFKKYDSSDNIINSLIPCYRKLDSTPGFYDIVNNQFYTNSNSSGTFIVGDDVN